MDSFLGGATGFGSSVPSYGDVGGGYSGDFFGGSSNSGIGSSILSGLGRGILGSLGGDSSQSSSPQSGPSYSNQARSNMRDLLALAIRSFGAPESVI